MARILITGAGGFIGGYFLKSLGNKRHKIRHLERKEWPNVEEAVRKFRPDYIYHFAAYGNKYNQTDKLEIYEANLTKLLILLEACQPIKYKAFVNVGSSSEYGKKDKLMSETDIVEPNTYYAASKAAGTLLARVWAIQENKPVITIRPFTVTGVGEQEDHLIPTLIRSCLLGKKMQFVKKPVHDYIDIEDLIRGIKIAAKHATKYKGDVFNIGSGKQYTNQQVRKIVEKTTGKKANIRVADKLRKYDTSKKWVADISKLKKLGWQPRKGLEQTIKEMIKTFKP